MRNKTAKAIRQPQTLPFRNISEEELAAIGQRASQATPGPWYPHRSDDELFSSAEFVSVEPGSFNHDNKRRMYAGGKQQAKPENVVAITVLQNPYLAIADASAENTLFIAHARTDVPKLIAEVRALRKQIAELEQNRS